MAENGDKTEKPTAQKLRKAREQGQIVRSRDVATAVGILVSLKLMVATAPDTLDDFRRLFAQSFVPLAGDGVLDNLWSTAFSDAMWLLAKMVLPLLVVPLAIIVGSLFPGGWMFNATHLQPKFERLSPLSNIKRLFTAKHASDVALPILKAIVLGIVLYHTCKDSVTAFLGLQAMTLDRALVHGAELMMDGIMALCMVFIVFALIDMPMQNFVFLRGQRMSQRDLKDEYKESEGSPEVRQRIRQLQRQFARRGLRSSVPNADAVIVNPEHYAVAVKYDEKRAEAPFVVAKGVDEMALYIRELAGQHAIPIVPLPPLARAIYNTSQVNQQIPAALYKAVAQVLHYVLQLKAFQSGRRPAQPHLPDVNVPSHLT
ncbi:MAG TPA: flagellar type III secretion system protein FlhB [Azonexus sp.]